MSHIGRATLLVLIAVSSSCGRSSSGGGGGNPPGPPAPPLPEITGPLALLPDAYLNIPTSATNFTGTSVGLQTWTVTGGTLPPGMTLSASGVYSGTPTVRGHYLWDVMLTDDNGSDSEVFEQFVVAIREEQEPNNVAGSADFMPAGIPGSGTLGLDDVDFWSFDGTVDQVIQVEVLGVRHDHAGWDTGGALPRVSVLAPNGTSFLVGHDATLAPDVGISGWNWGFHDMDIPMFRIPQNGTFFIRVEPDLAVPGGAYLLRLTTLSVGTIQVESEGNDTFGAADTITPGLIRGTRVDENDDLFSFTITAPTIVYFEITAYRNGIFGNGGAPDDDYFDPRLVLIDSDQSTLLAINDDGWFFYDSAIQHLITTPGTYYLAVTETGFESAGDGEYFLTYAETTPGADEVEANDEPGTANVISYGDGIVGFMETSVSDLDFFAFSGTAGDMVRVRWFDGGNHQGAADLVNVTIVGSDGFTPITAVFTRADFAGQVGLNCLRGILPTTGTYYVVVFGETSDTAYAFEFERVKDATFETESNNTINSANSLAGFGPGRAAGVIGSVGDVDMYTFSAQEGEIVVLSIYAGPASGSNGFVSDSNYGSELFPNIRIVNSNGSTYAATPYAGVSLSGESITNGLATSELAFVAPVTAAYVVEVSASDSTGGANHLYVLERR